MSAVIEIESPPQPMPWYRIHVLTVIALSLVVGAFVHRQFAPIEFATLVSHVFVNERSVYGWLFLQLEVIRVSNGALAVPIYSYRYDWFTWQPFANAAISMMLVSGVIIALERWQRSDRPWQFGIRGF